ncbi:ABC transporter permease [[Clostridium] fimetarium]|uniref:Putative ABC transport system permease protein n=1 Tax=[Clostridium] fimetarium TaxID=99656 RepID=A0A1I0P0A8_9FIRM|nr:ABC transporter permease [[Clostridium] fimetarium]SEW06891.1 putative ABC transport system permease protein [[Clostridium] fimetarium]
MKLFMIAKNNIKKAKFSTATLVILIAITTVFLYIGTNVLANIGTFIENKNTEVNGAHFIAIVDGKFDKAVKDICESIDGFQYMEREDAIMSLSSEFQDINVGEKNYSMSSILLNIGTKRAISTVHIIDQANIIPENGIIVPYVLKVSREYKTGDTLRFSVNGKSIDFEIAGFYEDLIFANPSNVSTYKLFIVDKKLNDLINNPDYGVKCSYTPVITNNINKSEDFENQYTNKLKSVITDGDGSYASLNYSTMKTGSSVFINIIMAVLVTFSIIVLAIALIVIRFSTATHIENNIKNIGAMEATGYTTRQILNSILLEYMIIAIVGYIVGIISSLLVSPAVSGIVSSSIGLRWKTDISLKAVTVSFVVIVLSVLAIAYFSAVKIKKITPLTALRNGIGTHNFKRNSIPLDKTKLNVNIALGIKAFIYNKKQNFMVGIIVMLLSVICVFAFTMYYNFVVDNTEMIKLTGMENADVQMTAQEDEDRIFDEIAEMPEVESTVRINSYDGIIDYSGKESSANIKITQDYSNLKINTCVKGRMPCNDNEITITSIVLDELGAKIGDTISIKYNDITREFLVVGITQHLSRNGRGAEITTQGMKKLVPYYEEKELLIHLKENVNTNQFVTKINNSYKDQKVQCINWYEVIDIMLKTFSSSIKIIVIGCVMITAFIIIFVMFLVIRVRILKERTRLGVSKALGFTSNQLIGHVVISEMPVILLASIIGSILGYIGTNPMMAMMLASNGILNCAFYIDISLILMTPLVISMLGLITILTVSFGIKKISPCKMFEEAKN